MSRFNTLLHGPAGEAADELGDEATLDEVRVALINALDRIERLERYVADLRESQP